MQEAAELASGPLSKPLASIRVREKSRARRGPENSRAAHQPSDGSSDSACLYCYHATEAATPAIPLRAAPRPVDFRYAVPARSATTCVGAKITAGSLRCSTVLQNGDQVDIVTSKAQTPSPTGKISSSTGKPRRGSAVSSAPSAARPVHNLGRDIAEAFRQEGYPFTEKALDSVLKTSRRRSRGSVRLGGRGDPYRARGHPCGVPGSKPSPSSRQGRADQPRAQPGERPRARPGGADPRAHPGMAVHYARCCHRSQATASSAS